jgi:hypothetical protein
MTQQPGYIYKITSTKNNLYYIGSTHQGIHVRFSKHKHDLMRYFEGKFNYCTSFDIMIYEDAKIEILKYFDNINNIDLKMEENKTMTEHKQHICNKHKSYDETAMKECFLCGTKYNKKFPFKHYESAQHQEAIFNNA